MTKPSSALPRSLGPYRLTNQLGAGGMGTVYRAEDTLLGREVAIKVLHPHLLSNAELKARFAREARLHASINHPNIVTLYNLHEEDGQLALVMEMVHGRSLKEYLASPRPLSLEHLLRIAIDILKGLSAAHEKGLVHRDLKPANILIADDGQVKIMDFGLAKQHGNTDDDLTQSGAVVGSYRYMAPEQIMHTDVDARTDLYAFGIVLFRMLTGVLPFDSSGGSGGEFEIMEKQVRETPPSPLELNPALPHALNHLLLQLLAKKPEERPQHCSEVIQRLEKILQSGDETHVTVVSNPSSSQDQTSAVTIASGLISAAGHEASRWWQHVLPAPVRRWLPALVVVLLLLWWMMGGEKAPSSVQPPAPPVVAKTENTVNHAPLITPDTTVTADEKSETPAVHSTEQATVQTPEPTASAEKPDRVKLHADTQQAPVLASLTSRQPYKLRRSDFTRSQPGQDEFSGHAHIFFEELRDYTLKERLHTFKTGYTRLTFSRPQQISQIVITKVSVGDADFTGGYIRLMVRKNRGRWQQLMEHVSEDIDHPETMNINTELNPLKEVKLMFKSAEPLEVADIRILGH